MPRVAGDNPNYSFRLVDWEGNVQDDGFALPSVTTIIKGVIGIPAGAMSWYGYRLALSGVAELLGEPEVVARMIDEPLPEQLETLLKEKEIDPNHAVSKAGDRGSAAHDVLEKLAAGDREGAERAADFEEKASGTKYARAVISWWEDKGFGQLQKEHPDHIASERRVWSLRHGYAGSLDLGIYDPPGGTWGIWDLKTHKPASGFTKPGFGAAYISDLLQIEAYASAWSEMGLGDAFPAGVVIARENGKYLEDTRRLKSAASVFLALIDIYHVKERFEKEGVTA